MRMSQNPSNQTSAGGERAADQDALSLPGAGGRLPLQSSTPARAAPTRGVKVVLLRGGLEGGREREVLDTADMTLDLQAPIDGLRALKGDLEVYYWDRPAGRMQESERYQITLWMRHLSERTAALEGILMHIGSPVVVLTGVDPAEREALRSAASKLDQWIHEEESFQDVLRHVAAILSAADTISLGAAAGRPEDRARRPA